jgi:hypothetical protein
MELPSAVIDCSGKQLAFSPSLHPGTGSAPSADPAELVVTLEEGRTYFDLVEFEAEALLRHRVSVTSSGAPGAHPRESLAPAPTA